MRDIFSRLIESDRSFGKVFFQIVSEEDIYSPDPGPVTALTLENELESQRLNRLAEVGRRIHRHVPCVFLDLFVMRFLLSVAFKYKFVEQFHIAGMPLFKRIERLQACFKKIDLIRVAQISALKSFKRVSAQAVKSCFYDGCEIERYVRNASLCGSIAIGTAHGNDMIRGLFQRRRADQKFVGIDTYFSLFRDMANAGGVHLIAILIVLFFGQDKRGRFKFLTPFAEQSLFRSVQSLFRQFVCHSLLLLFQS